MNQQSMALSERNWIPFLFGLIDPGQALREAVIVVCCECAAAPLCHSGQPPSPAGHTLHAAVPGKHGLDLCKCMCTAAIGQDVTLYRAQSAIMLVSRVS